MFIISITVSIYVWFVVVKGVEILVLCILKDVWNHVGSVF